MPNFEPLSTIRQAVRFPVLKILIVSAYDDDMYVQGLLDADCATTPRVMLFGHHNAGNAK